MQLQQQQQQLSVAWPVHARLALDDELFILAVDHAERENAAPTCLGWPESRLVGRNVDSLLPSQLARELRAALSRPAHSHDHVVSLVFGGAAANGSSSAMLLRYDNTPAVVQVSLAAVAPSGTPTGSLSSSDRWWRSYGYVLTIFESPELNALVDADVVAQFVARVVSILHRALSHTSESDDPQSASAMPISSRDSLTNWSDAGGAALSRDPSSTNLTFRRTPELSLSNDAPRLASLSDSSSVRPRLSGSGAASRTSRLAMARSDHAVHERDEALSVGHAATTAASTAALTASASSTATTTVAVGSPTPSALTSSPPRTHPMLAAARFDWTETSSANAAGSSTSPLDDELQIISLPLASLGAAQPNSEAAATSHRRALMRMGWIAARTHELQSRRYVSRDERALAELTALTLEMHELQNFVIAESAHNESIKSPVRRRHRRRRHNQRESELSSAAGSERSVPTVVSHLSELPAGGGGGLRSVTMPTSSGGGGNTSGNTSLRSSSAASISRRRVRTGRRRHTRRASAHGDDVLEPASRRSAGTGASLRRVSYLDDAGEGTMTIPALILNDPARPIGTDEPLTPLSDSITRVMKPSGIEASGVDFGDIKSSSSSTPPLAKVEEEPEAVLRAQSVPIGLARVPTTSRVPQQRSYTNSASNSRHGSWHANAPSSSVAGAAAAAAAMVAAAPAPTRKRTTTPDSNTLHAAIAGANLAPLTGNASGSNGGNGGSGGKRGSSEKSAAGVTLRQRVSTRACVVPLYRAEMVTSNSLAVRRLVSRSVRSNVHWLERYVTALHAAGWHPNVVFMHALVQLPTELWLVMEWCDNSSVSEAMRRLRAPLVEPQIAAVLKHAVAGLTHLRSHNICHGDIKCANIMLTSAGDAKLTDVTFSATLDAPAYREVVRSAAWQAPEIVLGGAPTFTSDVWALGVCALEMTFGVPPAPLVAVGGVAVPSAQWPEVGGTHAAGLAALVRACLVHAVEQRATLDGVRRMNFLVALDADSARRALAALATRCLRAQIASISGTRSGDTEASSFTNSKDLK